MVWCDDRRTVGEDQLRNLGPAEMYETHAPDWYLAEAARLREKADEATTDPGLRDNYRKLAESYESLAGALERTWTLRISRSR
jgi:hypothetical protein